MALPGVSRKLTEGSPSRSRFTRLQNFSNSFSMARPPQQKVAHILPRSPTRKLGPHFADSMPIPFMANYIAD